MKRVLIILTAFYFILNACNNSKNIESNAAQTAATIDSIKIDAIDTIMYQQGRDWKLGPHFHKIMLNDRDSIQYTEKNGMAERISSKFYTDTTATWVTAHQVNHELVLLRFRQWRANPQSNVQESISYFEDGKIFYSMERNKILNAGEDLGGFREAPFVENARPAAELLAEYAPYWEISKKAIEKDLQSRK